MYQDYAGREIEDTEMDNVRRDAREQTPFVGQRCHVNGKGFGTIITVNTPGTQVKVKLDMGRTAWFVQALDVELLAPPECFRPTGELTWKTVKCCECNQPALMHETQEGGDAGWVRHSYHCRYCGHAEADISIA